MAGSGTAGRGTAGSGWRGVIPLVTGLLRRHFATALTVALLAASAFFFVGAQHIRSVNKASNPELFADGDTVKILKAIDGDEMLIGNGKGGQTLLRILGIKSFSATASDPLLSGYGKICFSYLQSAAEGKAARIEVPEKRLGGQGRLLGTVFLEDEKGEYTVDLGLDLVRRGYALVYTRFDFARMEPYLAEQNRVKARNAGLWSDERIRSRAVSLMLLWQDEKRHD